MQSARFLNRAAASASVAAIRFAIYVWQPQRRLVVGVVGVALALVVGSILFRATVRDNLEATGRYRLSAEHVEVTPPPDWVRSDIVADAFERGGLAESNLLEDGLTEQIAGAFAISPWVRKVVQVRSVPVGRIQVDIEYRRPVAMVEVTLADGTGGLIFVDGDGVLLPTEDFRAADASRYLRLAPENARVPTSHAGTRWGDDRIERCAALAALLDGKREAWALYRIVLPASANAPVRIGSRTEAQIIWGALPGIGSGDEAPADVKLARIGEWTAGRGLTGADKSLVFDVRAKETAAAN